MHLCYEFIECPDVIFRIVDCRRENESQCIGRKVLERAPSHFRNVKAVIRTIETESPLLYAVMQDDIETPAKRHDEFLILPVGVSPPDFASRVTEDLKTLLPFYRYFAALCAAAE